jgi:AraC family transcriptional regulator
MSLPTTQQTYRNRILRVQLHIEEHLDEELVLEKLARLAHFSPYHFHRVFRALVGETVGEHVRRLRLERAALRLSSTDRPVVQVAFDAGYGTHEAFSRAFRQHFGVSPTEFRNHKRGLVKFPALAMEIPPMTEPTAMTGYEVRLVDRPPQRVAFLRHLGSYDQVGPTFGRLMAWAGPRGVFGPQTQILGVCHDDPKLTPADKLRYDCCVTVPAHVQPEGDVGVMTLESGPHAVITHKGPYAQLGQAYDRLYGAWLPTSGQEPRHAPPFEVYLNTPREVAPEDLLTEVYLPLEPR